MKHPAFDSIPKTLIFISIFILAGALIPLCLAGLIKLELTNLIIQGIISGLIICVISVLLWFVARFTRLNGLSPVQGILNHIALLLLALFVWLGIEYLILYLIFPISTFNLFTDLILFKIVIGTFVFIITIQYYEKRPVSDSIDDESETIIESKEKIHDKKPVKIETIDKITVKSGSNINIINVTDLLYIQAEGDYVILYTSSTRYIKEDTMKHIEELLPPYFLRIHRSCILNTNYISRIELYEKQNYKITLKTGQQLKASSSGYKLLKENLHL